MISSAGTVLERRRGDSKYKI